MGSYGRHLRRRNIEFLSQWRTGEFEGGLGQFASVNQSASHRRQPCLGRIFQGTDRRRPHLQRRADASANSNRYEHAGRRIASGYNASDGISHRSSRWKRGCRAVGDSVGDGFRQCRRDGRAIPARWREPWSRRHREPVQSAVGYDTHHQRFTHHHRARAGPGGQSGRVISLFRHRR